MLGTFSPASALGIWAEPYAGYEFGDREQNNSSYDASGINLGFRLGATNSSMFFGVEYALSNINIDQPGTDDEIKTTDLGAFFGLNFSMARLWLTYWLDSEGASDYANGTYSGSGGYKIGCGFKLFSSASLNFEKTHRNWSELEGSNLNQNITIDAVMVSLSLPLTF